MISILELPLIILITFGFSAAVPFAKVGLKDSTVSGFSTFYIGGILLPMILGAMIFARNINFATFSEPSVALVVLAALFGTVGYASGYIGLRKVHAGVSSTVFNLQGPLITLFGASLTRVLPSSMISIGLAVACVGLVMTGLPHFKGKSIMLGIPFIILVFSPILWALEWVTFSLNTFHDPLFSTMFLYLLIFLFFVINALPRKLIFSNTRKSDIFAFIGGSMAGIANASYGIFISTYGTVLTGVITLISVPASVGIVVLTLKERYSLTELIGLLIIGIGLAIALAF